MNKANLLTKTRASWDKLNAYVATLNENQLTVLTDAAGWTVRDHLIHLAVWEDGVWALLNHKNRREQMGIDEAAWKRWNFDEMNAIIQQAHVHQSWADVERERHMIHDRFVAQIDSMSEADLEQPMSDFNPESTNKHPIKETIVGDAYSHYDEHLPWIKAIAEKQNTS
ncbi:MAG: ClbS/DfsB family four-helix bundle protein [Anaerolineaceae bacterium]|nr:ClbS/DfsB family four-helix bundle protein [Anaerolineaceae bacterium]